MKLHSIKYQHDNSGISTLLLILIISFLLEIMLFGLFLASRASFNRSITQQSSQETYFAAEGAMNDTLLLLDSAQWPPSDPYQQEYKLGETTIRREVRFNSATNTYSIFIDAMRRGAKRRLVGEFESTQTQQSQDLPVDVMIVLDRSESLAETFSTVKSSVIGLIQAEIFTSNDRVGLVTFARTARLDVPLTDQLTAVETAVQRLSMNSGTNTAQAISYAAQELDQRGRPEALKYLLVLSDGVPTYYPSSTGSILDCNDDTCFAVSAADQHAPDNGGSACTDAAISTADLIKEQQYPIYTLYFQRVTGGSCNDFSRSNQLGSRTLEAISSGDEYYYQTESANELQEILESIGQHVIEREYRIQFGETRPE